MRCTINRLISDAGFDELETRVRKALADHGFDVLTKIDVKVILKTKIDVDMDPYIILGACNPNMAHQAIGMEPQVGAMLPCNVILRAGEGGVEISAIDPVVSMQAIENDDLHVVAGQLRDMLFEAIAAA